MDVTVENASSGNRSDIGADVEAFDRGVSLGDIDSQTTQEFVGGGEFLIHKIEVSRGKAVRQNERMQRRDGRCVADRKCGPLRMMTRASSRNAQKTQGSRPVI